MEENMRAILIDPVSETVSEVEYNGDYKHIYELCGFECFTVIDLGKGETLFIDDEGLLKEQEHFFALEGPLWAYPQPLAGRGLILGTDDDGESVATKLTLEAIRENVKWRKLLVAGFTPPRTYEDDDTPLGRATVIDSGRPIFIQRD
jgi:hypothetical protein